MRPASGNAGPAASGVSPLRGAGLLRLRVEPLSKAQRLAPDVRPSLVSFKLVVASCGEVGGEVVGRQRAALSTEQLASTEGRTVHLSTALFRALVEGFGPACVARDPSGTSIPSVSFGRACRPNSSGARTVVGTAFDRTEFA